MIINYSINHTDENMFQRRQHVQIAQIFEERSKVCKLLLWSAYVILGHISCF